MRSLFPVVALLAALSPPAAAEVPRADVVILGEVHDNPAHHVWQAEAVAALQPAALVFEMLLPEQAAAVTPELRPDAEALEAALGWEARGWPDFAMYHPIFTAAPEAQVFGADLRRERVRAALTEGAAAVFEDLFPGEATLFGLTRRLPEDEQAAREAGKARAHCHALPAEMLAGMVEAQRLRDAALARAAVQAQVATGGPVAVIAGTGHARTDRGLPAALALAAPHLTVYSVGQFEHDPGPDAPFDRVRVTDPADRPDPCAVFEQR